MPQKLTFFPTPADFRAWFEAHHDKFHQLLVGFHKTDSSQQSGLGILPFSSSLVSKGVHLLGRQRKKGRNKTQEAFLAHQPFAESANSAASHTREEEVTWPPDM